MTRIEDIIEVERKRLEGVLRAAYDAGREDARQEILRVLADRTQITDYKNKNEDSDDAPRKRAPRGLPKKLTDRVVSENALYGSSPQDIIDAAITEHEKMISISSIRSELRKGKADGRYIESDGLWYPADEHSNNPDKENDASTTPHLDESEEIFPEVRRRRRQINLD